MAWIYREENKGKKCEKRERIKSREGNKGKINEKVRRERNEDRKKKKLNKNGQVFFFLCLVDGSTNQIDKPNY